MNEQELKEKIRRLQAELRNCRNELCIQCGKYHMSYTGVCDDCRYRLSGEWRHDIDE